MYNKLWLYVAVKSLIVGKNHGTISTMGIEVGLNLDIYIHAACG